MPQWWGQCLATGLWFVGMTCTEIIAAAHLTHLIGVTLDGKLHLSALTAFGDGYDSCLPAASAPVLGSACCVVQSHLLPPLSRGTTVHLYSITKTYFDCA